MTVFSCIGFKLRAREAIMASAGNSGGATPTDDKAYTFDVANKEIITQFSKHAGSRMDQPWFNTDTGGQYILGGVGDSYVASPDLGNGILLGFEGRSGCRPACTCLCKLKEPPCS